MQLFLINAFSDLAKYFHVTILPDKIQIKPYGQLVTNNMLSKKISNYLFVNNIKHTFSIANEIITIPYEPISGIVAETVNGDNEVSLLPQLNIMSVVYPPKGETLTMNMGSWFVGTYIEYDTYNKQSVFEDEAGKVYCLSYAEIKKYNFEPGTKYEINCLGMSKKTKNNPYPAMIFEITQITG